MTDVEIRVGERTLVAHLESDHVVRVGQVTYTVERVGDDLYRVTDGAVHWDIAIAGSPESPWLFVNGQVAQVEVGSAALDRSPEERRRSAQSRDRAGGGDLASPMPATVIRILVEPGRRVARGETLLTLEAMKMELPIRAPRDGVVSRINCAPGDLVQAGVNLLDLE